MPKENLLALYLKPKLLVILVLGFASGLPLSLTLSTLSVWLKEAAVSNTQIGLFAAVTIPYATKFLWSPLIDQMPLPFLTKYLGRRRGWIIFTQALLVLSIFAISITDPQTQPLYTAFFALLIAFSSASQDIVIDAYRIESLERREQGAGAAMAVFGYRIGMLVSSAGALFIAEYFSWFTAYNAMAVMVISGSIIVLIAGEPEQSLIYNKGIIKIRTIKQWVNDAIIAPFSNFMAHKAWLLILVFVIIYKFGDAYSGVMTNPFLIEIGFNKTEIATVVKTFGFIASILGILAGGLIIKKYGVIRGLLICGILQMLSNLMFLLQIYAGYNITILAAVIAIENLSGGMGTAAIVAYLSTLCNINYTATQYALLSALASFGRTILSTSSGLVVDIAGWTQFFIISTIIALPGIVLLVFYGNYLRVTEDDK